MRVLIFSAIFVRKVLLSKKNSAPIIVNVNRSSYKEPAIIVTF